MPKKQNKQKKMKPAPKLQRALTVRVAAPRAPRQRVATARVASQGDYYMALTSPFADRALGARVPDMYSMPTIPLKLEGVFTVFSSAIGNISLAFNFHPLLTLIDTIGGAITAAPTAAYGVNNSVYPVADPTQLASLVANYRVVGGGVQISNLIPALACTGRVVVAPTATSAFIPNVELLAFPTGAPNVVNITSDVFGIPLSGFSSGQLPTNILNLPEAVEVTMQQLVANKLEFVAKPTGANSLTFKSTGNQDRVNTVSGQPIVDGFVPVNASTSGLFSGEATMPDGTLNSGFSGFLLRAGGLPVNTTALEIKYIMHLEGTPSVTANPLLPASHRRVVSMSAFHGALEASSRIAPLRIRPAGVQSRLFGNL